MPAPPVRRPPRFKTLRAVAVVLLCGGALGCPGKAGNQGKQAAPSVCTKLGEQCQLEPGKLGACSYRASCEGPQCLYCQSQH